MAYSYDFDRKGNLLRVTLSGKSNAAEMERSMREVTNDLHFSPGMDVLADLTGLTALDISPDQVGGLAVLHGLLDAMIGDGRLALVADSDPSLGFSRLYQAFGEQRTSMKIRIFSSVREAESWLGIKP